MLFRITFDAGDGQCAGRFQDRTGIREYVFDGGAGGIGIDQHHFVD